MMLAVCGAESPQKSVNNPPPLEIPELDESMAIVAETARTEAESRGYSVPDLVPHIREVGEFWEVTFAVASEKEGQLGGEGFVVRLKREDNSFVEVSFFQ